MTGPEPPRTSLFGSIDDLLRGRFTAPSDLQQGTVRVPVGPLLLACLVLGAISGVCMGLFAVFNGQPEAWKQVGASALKVPLLFLLTLLITFPSLYVVSALARSRLRFGDTLKLLLISIAIHMALVASLGPVAVFFTLSTTSYAFMKLLNFAFFFVSGFVSVGILSGSMQSILGRKPAAFEAAFEADSPSGSPDPSGGSESSVTVGVRTRGVAERDGPAGSVLRIWVLIYGVVGAQMGWILRPFIGSPDMEFEWFRKRESNILQAVWQAFAELFGAG